MDNTTTPRLVELVTRAQAIAKALNYIAGLARQMEVRQGCHKAMLESDAIASALSRLMAEGGLVGAATPAASLEVRERIARAISKWPCHIDGFHAVGYSTTACERWRATAYAQADEILALIGHDSDCATHNEPAMPNGPCDCSLLQRSEATGSPSNPVDDGAVERMRIALTKITDLVDSEADDPLDDAISIARKALEAAEPHP